MNPFKRIFHRCENHLEYLEGTRFPENGTTGGGKVWRNYQCRICKKCYTTSGHKLTRIPTPSSFPFIKIIG